MRRPFQRDDLLGERDGIGGWLLRFDAGDCNATKAKAISRARTAPATELAIITCSSSDNQGRSTTRTPSGPREDGGLRKPNEQSVLDYPCNGREPVRQRPRIGNSLERDIEYPVPLIRDESVAVAGRAAAAPGPRAPAAALAASTARRVAREPKRHHLDRQRKAPEHRHPFGLVGDHHHAGGGRSDDLLAQAARRRRP